MKVTRLLLRVTDAEWIERARKAGYHVTVLADRVPCSLKQLERFFLKHKGMTPHTWMMKLRLTVAARGLTEDLSVKEAASEAGYGNTANFCRAFKNAHGITPSEAACGSALGQSSATAENAECRMQSAE